MSGPEAAAAWTPDDVLEQFRALGLSTDYEPAIREHNLDGADLLTMGRMAASGGVPLLLATDMLKGMKIVAVGDQCKLLRFLKEVREGQYR